MNSGCLFACYLFPEFLYLVHNSLFLFLLKLRKGNAIYMELYFSLRGFSPVLGHQKAKSSF